MPMEPDWLDAREDRAWRAFMHARDQLNAYLNQHLLQDSGLSGADYEILAVLSGLPEGRMPAQELGALVHWEKSGSPTRSGACRSEGWLPANPTPPMAAAP